MHRSLSTGNKFIIQQKINDRNYNLHMERLRSIKKSSSQTFQLQNQDSELFRSTSILMHHNRKKEVQRENKLKEVDRENRILLGKMTDIVNNKMRTSLRNFSNEPEPTVFKVKSLNQNVRRNQIERIIVENHHIIKRIGQQTSVYSAEQWEKEHQALEKFRKKELPSLRRPKAPSKRDSQRSSYQGNEWNIQDSERKDKTSTTFTKMPLQSFRNTPLSNRWVSSRSKSSNDQNNFSRSSASLVDKISTNIAKKLVVHRTERKIGIKFYYIEFLITRRKFIIKIEEIKTSKVKKIVLSLEYGNSILDVYSGDFDKVAALIDQKEGEFFMPGFYEPHPKEPQNFDFVSPLTSHRTPKPYMVHSQGQSRVMDDEKELNNSNEKFLEAYDGLTKRSKGI